MKDDVRCFNTKTRRHEGTTHFSVGNVRGLGGECKTHLRLEGLAFAPWWSAETPLARAHRAARTSVLSFSLVLLTLLFSAGVHAQTSKPAAKPAGPLKI